MKISFFYNLWRGHVRGTLHSTRLLGKLSLRTLATEFLHNITQQYSHNINIWCEAEKEGTRHHFFFSYIRMVQSAYNKLIYNSVRFFISSQQWFGDDCNVLVRQSINRVVLWFSPEWFLFRLSLSGERIKHVQHKCAYSVKYCWNSVVCVRFQGAATTIICWLLVATFWLLV